MPFKFEIISWLYTKFKTKPFKILKLFPSERPSIRNFFRVSFQNQGLSMNNVDLNLKNGNLVYFYYKIKNKKQNFRVSLENHSLSIDKQHGILIIFYEFPIYMVNENFL